MNDESLSALLDGQCNPAELDRLLDALEQSPELKARWSRMCLMREAHQGTQLRAASLEFSSRVMAALDDRPAAAGVRVIPFRPRSGFAWRPLVGWAAAAALAAVALLGVFHNPTTSAPAATTVTATAAIPASQAAQPIQPVALRNDPRGGEEEHWAQMDAEYAQQLNGYLMDYSNYRAQQAMGGTLGYARYAAHTAEYRPDDR